MFLVINEQFLIVLLSVSEGLKLNLVVCGVSGVCVTRVIDVIQSLNL